jgi:hypothetical protein
LVIRAPAAPAARLTIATMPMVVLLMSMSSAPSAGH